MYPSVVSWLGISQHSFANLTRNWKDHNATAKDGEICTIKLAERERERLKISVFTSKSHC